MEKLAIKNSLKSYKLNNLELFLKFLKIKNILGNIYKKLLLNKNSYLDIDYKFPSLEIKKIRRIISKFQKVLNIDKNLECKLLYDRTILIKIK